MRSLALGTLVAMAGPTSADLLPSECDQHRPARSERRRHLRRPGPATRPPIRLHGRPRAGHAASGADSRRGAATGIVPNFGATIPPPPPSSLAGWYGGSPPNLNGLVGQVARTDSTCESGLTVTRFGFPTAPDRSRPERHRFRGDLESGSRHARRPGRLHRRARAGCGLLPGYGRGDVSSTSPLTNTIRRDHGSTPPGLSESKRSSSTEGLGSTSMNDELSAILAAAGRRPRAIGGPCRIGPGKQDDPPVETP